MFGNVTALEGVPTGGVLHFFGADGRQWFGVRHSGGRQHINLIYRGTSLIRNTHPPRTTIGFGRGGAHFFGTREVLADALEEGPVVVQRRHLISIQI